MKSRRRILKMLVTSPLLAACSGEREVGDDDGAPTSASGGGGGAGGVGGQDPGALLPPGYTEIGHLEGLPIDAVVPHPSLDVFVGRDAAGVYVMTSRCTHEQCNMINNDGVATDGTINCGCHGSRFDSFGVPLNGPALSPLPHFHVVISGGGFIGANFDEQVEVSFRAPVP